MATQVRRFLEPHWPQWHDAWGPPVPRTPSQWTCVRSSLMLLRALERQGVRATLESGQDRAEQRWGRVTADGVMGHAWVEASGSIIDITADQFGLPPVILTPKADPAYRRAPDAIGQLSPSRSAIAAIDLIWPSWCSLADPPGFDTKSINDAGAWSVAGQSKQLPICETQ